MLKITTCIKFIAVLCFLCQTNQLFSQKTIKIPTNQGFKLTADVYLTEDKKAPFILLCHQAGYSRGEYLEIAPKLNAMGFNCIAIDQRSGKEVNGVVNQTNIDAVSMKRRTNFQDAYQDVSSAIKFIKKTYKTEGVIVWGSSYSAALAIIVGAKRPDDVWGVIAFSPADYFIYEGRTINAYAKGIKAPVFFTSALSEHDKWAKMYKKMNKKDRFSFLPTIEGQHGSKALWEKNEGHDEYWEAVTVFLMHYKE